MNWDELPPLFPGFPSPDRWLPLLQAHDDLLETERYRVRATAVPPAERVRRHYAESLETLRIALAALADPATVVDVGSGGGFPGIPWAAVLPGSAVALVEPLQKRARLLEEAKATLDLGNVTVVAARAEDAGRGPLRDTATLVTARAVAPLAELLEYVAPFAATGALIALPKGSALEAELESATPALAALACELHAIEPMRPEISEHVRVALLRKRSTTPAPYPRRPGIPAKRPIK